MSVPQFNSSKKNPLFPSVTDISPADLRSHLNEVVLIDVREADEWVGELKHIKSARHIPLGQLSDHIENLINSPTAEQAHVFICRSGQRSARATDFVQSSGLKHAFNLQGGMKAWSPQYPETLE